MPCLNGYNHFMIEPNLHLQKPLEDYVEYTEKLSLRSIALLDGMSEPSFSFQDPYYNVVGRIEAYLILEHRLKTYPNAIYKVSDFMWGRRQGVAYMFWSYRYLAQKKLMERSEPEPLVMEGMSELKFLPNGKIYSCCEFWGEHSGFNIKAYKKLPQAK